MVQNEERAEAVRSVGVAGPVLFRCECGARACFERVWVDLDDYQALRLRADLVLAEGHAPAAGEG